MRYDLKNLQRYPSKAILHEMGALLTKYLKPTDLIYLLTELCKNIPTNKKSQVFVNAIKSIDTASKRFHQNMVIHHGGRLQTILWWEDHKRPNYYGSEPREKRMQQALNFSFIGQHYAMLLMISCIAPTFASRI